MQQTCEHMLERRIQHWQSGFDELLGIRYYRPGDSIALVCPHGCEPIVVDVVKEVGEREHA